MLVAPVAAKIPGDRAHDGGFQVGVFEDDVRGLAAELKRDVLNAPCCRLIDSFGLQRPSR